MNSATSALLLLLLLLVLLPRYAESGSDSCCLSGVCSAVDADDCNEEGGIHFPVPCAANVCQSFTTTGATDVPFCVSSGSVFASCAGADTVVVPGGTTVVLSASIMYSRVDQGNNPLHVVLDESKKRSHTHAHLRSASKCGPVLKLFIDGVRVVSSPSHDNYDRVGSARIVEVPFTVVNGNHTLHLAVAHSCESTKKELFISSISATIAAGGIVNQADLVSFIESESDD